MQDQITELAARLARAETKPDIDAVDIAIHHARRVLKERHKLTVNLLLAQIATLKEIHDADDDKLRELEKQAEAKLEPFEAMEEVA